MKIIATTRKGAHPVILVMSLEELAQFYLDLNKDNKFKQRIRDVLRKHKHWTSWV